MAIPYFTGSNDAGELRQYLNILIGYINGITQSTPVPPPSASPRLVNLPSGGNLNLLTSDSTVLVNNTGGVVVHVLPPSPPAANQRILIKDVAGTAGANNILFTGTVDTEVNPVLIGASFGTTELLFSSGVIYRTQ